MLDRITIRSRSIPPDPPRRRGATTAEPAPDRFGWLWRLLAATPWLQVALGLLIVVLAGLVPWGTGQVLSAMDRQFTSVVINGPLEHENRQVLQQRASAWLGKSFFATDLADIKAAIEQRPWVESAAVRRVWPDGLSINVREKKPLAYWNDRQLVSRRGDVFTPGDRDNAGALPRLSGPDDRVDEVVSTAQDLSRQLAANGLGFAGLQLEPRGAWTLLLANGIEVALGRDQIQQRFKRFMTVYEGELAAHAEDVERVDARYTNGVAVRWKKPDSTPGKNT